MEVVMEKSEDRKNEKYPSKESGCEDVEKATAAEDARVIPYDPCLRDDERNG